MITFSFLKIEINGFIIVIAGLGNILTVIMQYAVIICDILVFNPRTIELKGNFPLLGFKYQMYKKS